jgi:hypothetical protein
MPMGKGRAKKVGGVSHGRLRYLTGEQIVLFAKTAFGARKICRIFFGRDGSVYVPFPYMKDKCGLLSVVRDNPTVTGPVTYDLATNGVVVDYDIKYSHHTSGIVQFSRSGKEVLLPRRRAFPLDGFGGTLFMATVFYLRGLEPLQAKAQDGELRVGLDFKETHPFGIQIVAEWVRKDVILQRTEAGTWPVGPIADAKDRAGNPKRFMFLGQHPDSPLQDHLLVISAGETPVPPTVDRPTMIFFGGIDRPAAQDPGALAFMFPVERPSSPANVALNPTSLRPAG